MNESLVATLQSFNLLAAQSNYTKEEAIATLNSLHKISNNVTPEFKDRVILSEKKSISKGGSFNERRY